MSHFIRWLLLRRTCPRCGGRPGERRRVEWAKGVRVNGPCISSWHYRGGAP